jgi:hypothetical protein
VSHLRLHEKACLPLHRRGPRGELLVDGQNENTLYQSRVPDQSAKGPTMSVTPSKAAVLKSAAQFVENATPFFANYRKFLPWSVVDHFDDLCKAAGRDGTDTALLKAAIQFVENMHQFVENMHWQEMPGSDDQRPLGHFYNLRRAVDEWRKENPR